MMHRFILCVLCLIIISKLFAQHNGRQVINGKVVDAETKLPIEAASIFAPLQNISSISSEDGNFSILLKNTEKEQLTASAIGYLTKTIEVRNHLHSDKTI